MDSLLALIFWLLLALIFLGSRKKRQAKAMLEGRPVSMSKSSFSEFREAITAELSPGEQLLAACECYSPSWREKKGGGPVQLRWFILTVTNINMREFWWRPVSTPEVGKMNTFPISDVSSYQYGSSKPHKEVRKELDRSFNARKQLDPSFGDWRARGVEGETASLHLRLLSGETLKYYSPHRELRHFTKQLDTVKSGALIVKNTTAAADALDQLVPLLNDGILTQEEFDRAKEGFLGATVEVRESSVGLLRQLHSLYKSGVLSESEFNLKKWNILSEDG